MSETKTPSQESAEYAGAGHHGGGSCHPASWCARMRDNAPDGETAYHYHQLEQMWRERQ